jgi:predicted nucleic acid-binding protein
VRYLIDTTIVSEPTARRPNLTVLHWIEQTPLEDRFISEITLGEILKGIAALRRRGNTERVSKLTEWAKSIEDVYGDRIIPIDIDVVHTWGNLNPDRTLPYYDSLIAATALTHNLTLVTRNVRDFVDLPLTIINPFDI